MRHQQVLAHKKRLEGLSLLINHDGQCRGLKVGAHGREEVRLHPLADAAFVYADTINEIHKIASAHHDDPADALEAISELCASL